MNYEDRHAYELSLKYYRDFINVMDTAKKDAKEEGKLEGKIERELEIAKTMLEEGFDIKIIEKITGLTEAMILNQNY
jgi:predicted transposase/invertase (TIGR01784 family)